MFALARDGELRTPSESLNLELYDIDWERDRFKVRSSKTGGYGTVKHIVPLRPKQKAEPDA